jgi:hypothetical protein
MPDVGQLGAPTVPQIEIRCPRCRGGGFGGVARFELRLPEHLHPVLTRSGAADGPGFVSAMTEAAKVARVASIGRDANVVRIPDGQFVVRCSECDWAHRFAPEQIRRAVVISTLRRLQSPDWSGWPVAVSADLVTSNRWSDWDDLRRGLDP